MAENSHQMNSNTYTNNHGLRGSYPLNYNPQQNWVAETKNRTIMEAIRSMLHDQDLPMHLWVEATRTSVYV